MSGSGRHDAVRDALTVAGDGRPLLLRGGTVLSMDPRVGDLPIGDVLVDGGRISAVAARVDAIPPDTIEWDVSGSIVMPGFVDGHRHCWQGSFRHLAVDADLSSYLAITHDGVARHFAPDDMYIGNLVALLGALDAGFTSILDLSHNSRSIAHVDAVFDSYRAAGIRAVHASAPPNAGEWDEHWPKDLDRLAEACSTEELISVRAALDLRRVAPAEQVMAQARGLGIGIHMDGVMGVGSSAEIAALGRAGGLADDVTLVHATSLDDAAWEQIVASGTRIVLAPTSDELLGLAGAVPPVQRMVDHGLTAGLSVDVEISLPGDPFTLMRTALMTQRMLAYARRTSGQPDAPLLSHAEVLRWATLGGAEASGLGDVVGSVSVGKSADLLVIDAAGINNIPGGNPIGAVVQASDRSHIRAVFVGGVLKKWDGELLDVDILGLADKARSSRDRLLALAGFELGEAGLDGSVELGDAGLRDYLGSHEHE